MIKHAILPATIEPQNYWVGFVQNFGRMLEAAGVEVRYEGHSGDVVCGIGLFKVIIDGVAIVVDYSDHPTCEPCFEGPLLRLKCTYHLCYDYPPEVIPFAPRTFADWGQYERCKGGIEYKAKGKILYKQRIFAGRPCAERRSKVAAMLREAFPSETDDKEYPIEQYWGQINDCLVRVFAPGTEPDRLDRGHAQYMAFGCCTISPMLEAVLPHKIEFDPGWNYIACRDDYSDVIDLVKWCKENPAKCLKIGRNAAALFAETMSPEAQVDWLEENL